MDIDKLVNLITKEVMNRLNSLESKKEKILFLGEKNENVTNLLSNNYLIDFCKDLTFNVNEYKYIIISNLSNKELVNISLGISSGTKEEFIVNSIMQGKKIYILLEGMEYKKYKYNCNPNFYKLFCEYEDKIKSFGVNIINEINLFEALQTKECVNKENNLPKKETIIKDQETYEIEKHTNEEIYLADKKLISENDLRKLYRTDIRLINIAKKCVITPLAQDFIRINRIKVNRI